MVTTRRTANRSSASFEHLPCGRSRVRIGGLAVALGTAIAGIVGCGLAAGSGEAVSGGSGAVVVVHSPEWSPDGKLLAFVRGSLGGTDAVYALPASGGAVRRLSLDFEGISDFAWSPRRRELLVRDNGDALPGYERGEIVIVPLVGPRARPLAADPADDRDPVWSPDGNWVAFASNRSGDYELYVVDRKGQRLRRLTHDPACDLAPAWSPDGRTLLYRRTSGCGPVSFSEEESVRLVGAAGSGDRELVRVLPEDNLNAAGWRAAWSPDGRRVALDLGARITIVDVERGTTRTLPGLGLDPRWSPDGGLVLYDGFAPCPECYISVRIAGLFVTKPDGRGRVSLLAKSRAPFRWAVDASWSPDGRLVAVVGEIDGERAILLVKRDGSGFRRLVLDQASTE